MIIFPDRSMPRTCSECPAYNCEICACNAFEENFIDLNWEDAENMRNEKCPLIEIPDCIINANQLINEKLLKESRLTLGELISNLRENCRSYYEMNLQ